MNIKNSVLLITKSEYIRYLISGFLSFVVENLTFSIAFYALKINSTLSNLLSIGVAMTINYALLRSYVFSRSESSGSTRFIMYFILVVSNAIISSLLIRLLISWGIPGFIAKGSVTIAVICWTFIINKWYIFRQKDIDTKQ